MVKKPEKSANAISFENGYFSVSKYYSLTQLVIWLISYFKAATRIAVQNPLHDMPELRSFPRYQGILRVSETKNKQFHKGQSFSVKLPFTMYLLQRIIPVKKFPHLGINLVQFWIFCLIHKVVSLLSSVKYFVQEIIYFAKQQLLSTFNPMKMNYKRGCKKPVFMNIYLTLFIININYKDEKCNRIWRNNYCPLKLAFI